MRGPLDRAPSSGGSSPSVANGHGSPTSRRSRIRGASGAPRKGISLRSHPAHRGAARARDAPGGRLGGAEEGPLQLHAARRLGRRGRGHLQPDGRPRAATRASAATVDSRRRRHGRGRRDRLHFTNPGTITFAAGETRKTFPVTIIDNTVVQPAEQEDRLHALGSRRGASPTQFKNNPADADDPRQRRPGHDRLQPATPTASSRAPASATITVTATATRCSPRASTTRPLTAPRPPAATTPPRPAPSRSASARCPRPSRSRSPTTRPSRATRRSTSRSPTRRTSPTRSQPPTSARPRRPGDAHDRRRRRADVRVQQPDLQRRRGRRHADDHRHPRRRDQRRRRTSSYSIDRHAHRDRRRRRLHRRQRHAALRRGRDVRRPSTSPIARRQPARGQRDRQPAPLPGHDEVSTALLSIVDDDNPQPERPVLERRPTASARQRRRRP